jgi:hypothetical protein
LKPKPRPFRYKVLNPVGYTSAKDWVLGLGVTNLVDLGKEYWVFEMLLFN